jgi:hypothetical protein
MATRVVHCKKEPYDVYIGRGRGSPFGNPYSHQEGTLAKFKVGSRAEAIQKFREYALQDPALLQQIKGLKGKVLGCWCKPQDCHGDVIAEICDRE